MEWPTTFTSSNKGVQGRMQDISWHRHACPNPTPKAYLKMVHFTPSFESQNKIGMLHLLCRHISLKCWIQFHCLFCQIADIFSSGLHRYSCKFFHSSIRYEVPCIVLCTDDQVSSVKWYLSPICSTPNFIFIFRTMRENWKIKMMHPKKIGRKIELRNIHVMDIIMIQNKKAAHLCLKHAAIHRKKMRAADGKNWHIYI